MGMDISGLNPTNKKGQYIRFAIGSWPQYARYMELIAPDLTSKIKYLYTNDGDGLNAEDSKILGEKILQSLNSQLLVNYVELLPEQPTSWRKEGNQIIEGNYRKLFDVERLRELGEFLVHCGGFEIY